MPSAFNTSEFRRSDGPLQHNAAIAWNAGRTGQGVTIAVLDSGIDDTSPEFAGRIAAASKDMYDQGRPLKGPDMHGDQVALVAAAARNNSGIMGIAYNSTVLALRSDDPGTCSAPTSPSEKSPTECKFDDGVLARAVTYAVQSGAKVINMSLGGDDGASAEMIAAVQEAVTRGVLVVVSAGNEGTAEVNSFAASLDQNAPGGVIVVGSVDENGAISSFSDRAGGHAGQYLAARGEAVCCVYSNGQIYVDKDGYQYAMSGTSFSAPQVSGAAALLAQAFPNLSGKQIAQILLNSAFDAGASGTDAVYGHGILDIAKAFQPSGTTTLAGTTTAVALGDTSGSASPTMGDALRTASLPTVILDEYSRAYETDLAGTLRGAQPTQRLAASVGGRGRSVMFGSAKTSLAFSIDDMDGRGQTPRLAQLRLSRDDAEQAQVLAARLTAQINSRLQLGFAYREQADGLAAQLQGQSRPAFMIAPAGARDSAEWTRPANAFALRQKLGRWGLTASAEQGRVANNALSRAAWQRPERWRDGGVASYSLALDRTFGSLTGTAAMTWQSEADTILGGQLPDAFQTGGANSVFLDATAGWQLADHWRAGATWRDGLTRARQVGLVAAGSDIHSRAWAIDLTREGVFGLHDTLGVRVSQPLRVESGALNLSLPVAWSYQTMMPTYGIETLGLAPQGRELVTELAWAGALWGGNGSASLFYRRDPGHYETLPDDKGLALRWLAHF